MNPATVGYISIIVFLVLIFLGLPIAVSMGVVGFVGIWVLKGTGPGLGLLATVPYTTVANYGLAVIPLFMLMGEFALYSGLAGELYDGAYKWLGQFRGGLATATMFACAIFSTISGSSTATALTFGTVAMPHMRRYNYSDSLATAACAAGATLDIMIPPSIVLVMYGILTENSIGKLFVAGFIPGAILSALFIATIYIYTRYRPDAGPPGPKTTLKEKMETFKVSWVVIVLFVIVIGGIFLGWFTPTEAAAVGVTGAFVIALARRKLTRKNFVTSLVDTSRLAGMALFIVFSAFIFGYFITQTGITQALSDFLGGLAMSRYIVMIFIIILYVILGAIMDEISMLVITLPFTYPVVMNLGFDPIWFGIIMVLMSEMGLICPPVAMNLFILSGVSGVPVPTISRGIWPFILAILVCIVILLAFPEVATFLPQYMKY